MNGVEWGERAQAWPSRRDDVTLCRALTATHSPCESAGMAVSEAALREDYNEAARLKALATALELALLPQRGAAVGAAGSGGAQGGRVSAAWEEGAGESLLDTVCTKPSIAAWVQSAPATAPSLTAEDAAAMM